MLSTDKTSECVTTWKWWE